MNYIWEPRTNWKFQIVFWYLYDEINQKQLFTCCRDFHCWPFAYTYLGYTKILQFTALSEHMEWKYWIDEVDSISGLIPFCVSFTMLSILMLLVKFGRCHTHWYPSGKNLTRFVLTYKLSPKFTIAHWVTLNDPPPQEPNQQMELCTKCLMFTANWKHDSWQNCVVSQFCSMFVALCSMVNDMNCLK